jgi:alpha-glucuronidase
MVRELFRASLLKRILGAAIVTSLCFGSGLSAEISSVNLQSDDDRSGAWLRYLPVSSAIASQYANISCCVLAVGDAPLLKSAQQEIARGIGGGLGKTIASASTTPKTLGIIVGTVATIDAAPKASRLALPEDLPADSYILKTASWSGSPSLIVAGSTERGALYGAFALLRKIEMGEPVNRLDEVSTPYAAIRWTNEWDNLDGSIERGYGGGSIFFADGAVRQDLSRVREYARLLASVGINGCAINNVNADPKILTSDFIPQLARVAAVFREYGIQLGVSVNFASPKAIGGLDTFDPLDPKVIDWWAKKADEIYAAIPDFGGFVLKADSEDRPGPATYHRTAVEGANSLARALKPHGGILFYRGFVYDHHLDWHDMKADRARAAYDVFHTLDGQFDSNVILQIKNGPIDFQVREPASPLFGAMKKTNQAIELQITQEYLGQGRHVVFLPPMWKQTLDFDMQADGPDTPVKAIVAGKVFPGTRGGFVGVSNVGLDSTWLGNYLSAANLYGYGRLAWDPSLSAQQIADEWTRLTFGNNPDVVNLVASLQTSSWKMYEDYTGPLGAGTLTAIAGDHFEPSVESSERNGWGQWHRADANGIGMDRTVATGTGYAGQYPPAVAALYESLATTPDELLLFFHHVPYTYVLHSGKTVIQHIYDSHYDGAARAEQNVARFQSLQGKMDADLYSAILARLEYQEGAAELWRDAISNWLFKTSGIPDAQRRVGNHPHRIAATKMSLNGYTEVDVSPWEDATDGKAVACDRSSGACTASWKFDDKAGTYKIDVRYFDQNDGVASFDLAVNGKKIDAWEASDTLPTKQINGSSSTRRRSAVVALNPGDAIQISGTPNGGDKAALDYIEFLPTSK